MDGKIILVTGGAGFIGSNIVEKLYSMPVKKIIVLDNLFAGKFSNISEFLGEKVQFINGDIRDVDLLNKICKEVDIICHQAAWGSVPRSLIDPRSYHDNNVTGFFNVLEAARENNIKRVVYASSSSVYGDEPNLPKKEIRIGKQLAPYGISKYIDEVYADIYRRCYGLEVIGLRYFNVFGPKQNPEGAYAAVIPKFINLLLERKPITINGDGTYSRDFTYIENVVDFNLKCMVTDNEEAFGKVFNVACGNNYSLNDLAGILVDKIGYGEIIHGENRKGDIEHSLADISLGMDILGYKPLVLFEEGLERTIRYLSFKMRSPR